MKRAWAGLDGIVDGRVLSVVWVEPWSLVNRKTYMAVLKEKMMPTILSRAQMNGHYYQQDGAPLTMQQNLCSSWRSIFKIASSAGELPVHHSPLDFWMLGEIDAVIKDKKPESIEILKEIVNYCKRRMDRDKVLRA